MLVLTRRIGEAVVVGEDIVVTVLGIKGNQIRLGVKAPRALAVHRNELLKKKADGGAVSQELIIETALAA
jgi:carbon storage regulator